MSSVLTTAGIRRLFDTEFEAASQSAVVDQLCFKVTSNAPSETFRWLAPLTPPRQRRGDILTNRPAGETIIVNNLNYDLDTEFDEDDWEDDKTGSAQAKVAESAQSLAVQPLRLISDLINAGATTTYGNAYTGTTFFGTHTAAGGFVNDLTATEVTALNVTTPGAPTAEEAAKVVTGIVAYMMGFANAQGEPFNEMGRRYVLGVPPALAAPFLNGVLRDNLASGETNPVAGLRAKGFSIDVVPMPRLNTTIFTTQTRIVCFRVDGPWKPFILQERRPASVDILGPGSEYTRLSRKVRIASKWGGGAGFGRPEYAVRATLS